MTYDTLSDFLDDVEQAGSLLRIDAAVDPRFELAEICRQATAATDDPPAILFENVRGADWPVVANLLGSSRRMLTALRAESFDQAAERLFGLVTPEVPETWVDAVKLVPRISQLASVPPKVVKTAACQQVVEMGRDVDLDRLPIPRFWPQDDGPAITMGQVHTKSPAGHSTDVAGTLLTRRDAHSLFVHWTVHDDGWRNYVAHRERNLQMPVAVALGGDPLNWYAAQAPLPPDTDPCLLSGLLRGCPVERVQCRSVELQVPAGAEVVLEGYVDTAAALELAGPVGTTSGFAGVEQELPVMHVSAVTHRANPVFPVTVHGPPPSEADWTFRATERLLVPFLRLFAPEVADLHLPRAAAGRNLLFVSFRKSYPGQARKVLNAVWGLAPLVHSKIVVVVDEDVNVHDEEEVWFHVGSHVHPERDVAFWEGPNAADDHASPVRGVGSKMGLDATRKLPEEGHPRPWPDPLQSSEDTRERVRQRWSEYGFGS